MLVIVLISKYKPLYLGFTLRLSAFVFGGIFT